MASLRAGVRELQRPELRLAEAAAPQRLAPFAVALTADVEVDEVELASGRLVLLHDPAGHDSWQGAFRVVTYVRADVEPEMGADPLLPSVGWAWLVDALAGRNASHVAPSGTVTRVASESFGALVDRPAAAEVEIRASWTPLDAQLAPHLSAWCDLLYAMAGLPPDGPADAPANSPAHAVPRLSPRPNEGRDRAYLGRYRK